MAAKISFLLNGVMYLGKNIYCDVLRYGFKFCEYILGGPRGKDVVIAWNLG